MGIPFPPWPRTGAQCGGRGSAELQHDDARRITEKARADGVQAHLEVWPEMIHNFQTFGEGFPEAVRGTGKLCEHLLGLLREGRPRPE
jgi:acetyl esterase/lipase